MNDDKLFEGATPDIFEQMARGGRPAPPTAEDENDPSIFEKLAKSGGVAPPQSTASGAFGRAAVRGLIPSVGSLPAVVAGAEIGATLGRFGGGWGTLIGAVGGGLFGGYVGQAGLSAAQDWAISKLPDSWQEAIGQDERQRRLDEAQHPTASFLGGLAPFALTMRPGAIGARALPENATAYQRIMAHPVTSRVFGGALMGGLETSQEVLHGESPDWTKIAISTGFGMVFNKPTRLGEGITEIGARPARRMLGRELPAEGARATEVPPPLPEGAPALETAPAEPSARPEVRYRPDLFHEPTIAQAADAKVAGPGITEDVYLGSHQQAEPAQLSAQDAVRNERMLLGREPTQAPDLHNVARRMHPDLMSEYDELTAMRDSFRNWVNEAGPEHAPVAAQRLSEIEGKLDAIGPQVAATYRRAAEAIGAETRGPDVPTTAAETGARGPNVPTTEGAAATSESVVPAAQAANIGEQKAAIASDVARQLQAAGRDPQYASAASQLIAARYEARAGWFNGALGTPQQLYEREGARIVGPGGARVARGAAPAAAPAAPTTRQELATAIARGEPVAAAPAQPAEARAPEPLPPVKPVVAGAKKGPAAVPEKEYSLLQFLAARGGISPRDPLITEFRDAIGKKNFQPGFGNVIAAEGRGMPLDRAREAAVEAGYLFDKGEHTGGVTESTIQHLLDAAERDAGKDRVYRPDSERAQREKAPDAGEQRHRAQSDADDYLETEQMKPSDLHTEDYDRMVDMIQNHGMSPAVAYERAIMEGEENAIETKGRPDRDFVIPGWDVPDDAGAAQAARAATEAGRPVPGEASPEAGGDHRAAPAGAERPRIEGGTSLDRVASWVIRNKTTKEVVMETFDPKKVEHLNMEKYEAVPIADYLGQLNNNMREGEHAAPSREQELEYFQRRREGRERNLIAEREGQGQLGLPGTERATQGELAQRGADAALKPTVAQKPMDEGLFGDAKLQKELFQRQLGSYMPPEFTGKEYPIIKLAREADWSTFAHEEGHDFLDQMRRDAAHPLAPGQLRDDFATVVDWLGLKSGDDLEITGGRIRAVTRRAQEKFARGFEQYLREGVAPSPGLADVFAKFKDWLTRIYQTLKGLGQPINEDIRRVFDRMLSTEPNRTVIAPEREIPPSIADEHELDARLTPEHSADPQAALVRAETERHINEPPPEIAHELERTITRLDAEAAERQTAREGSGEPGAGAAEPAGSAEPGTERPGQVGERGGAAGTEPQGGGVGVEREPVVRGGANAAGESAGARGEPAAGTEPAGAGTRPESREDARSQPLAPAPAHLLGAAESPFLDKAGNIRLDTLSNAEDVRAAIRDSAAENNDFIGDRRGVVTDGDVMNLADAIGMDAEYLSRRKIGQAFNAEQIMAARKLLIASATDVSAAMKKAATGTDEDVLAYALAKDRHQMIQGHVAGITAEAGRALRAFRNIIPGQENARSVQQFLNEATGKTLFQLRTEAKLGAQLESPEQVSKFTHDASRRGFGSMLLEYWINGLISGPATHTTYAVGNQLLALEKAGPETAAAAGIGALARALGREGATVRFGEVPAQLKAMATSAPANFKAAIDAFRTGVTTLLPGETARTMPLQPGAAAITPAVLDEATGIAQAGASLFGFARGIKDGIVSSAALLAAGGEAGAPLIGAHYTGLGAIPDIAIRGVPVLPIGSVIRTPGRFIAAIHSYFRSMNYAMSKAAGAYRAASEEGLTGTAFDARVADGLRNPTPEQMEGYRHEATELTLMGQGGEFTRNLARLTNTRVFGVQLLKFIDPFVHISGNIIDQSIIQRTPVGLLSPELRADLMGRNGNIAQDMAAARMLVGTAISVGMGVLAGEGFITGSAPTDRNEAAAWRRMGKQEHSVRVGDMWYDVHRLGPMGMLLGVAADMYEVAHLASKEDYTEAAAHFQHALTQNILDESFMRGPADLIKAVEDPGRYGANYIRSTLSSFVPFSVGMAQMARAADPYTRQARTVVDAMKAKVPGLSETLLPKRDIWGEPVPNKDVFGIAGLSAIYASKVSTDPVEHALDQLGIYPAQPTRKIRNVDLDDEEYDDFSRIAGRTTKMRLDAIVKSQDFQNWPNHIKHDVILETIRQSREMARGLMMARYPHIMKEAVNEKLEKLKD